MIEVIDSVDSAESVLKILQESPSRGQVEECLKFLRSDCSFTYAPGALSSQLITALITKTLPDFYDPDSSTSSAEAKLQSDLLCSLESVPGLGAISARLGSLLKEGEQNRQRSSTHDVRVLFDVLDKLLKNTTCSERIWQSIVEGGNPIGSVNCNLLWREYISLVAGSKVVATAAVANDEELGNARWIADGRKMSEWLAKNVAHLILTVHRADKPYLKDLAPATQLCSRCLSFGYLEAFLAVLVRELCIVASEARNVLSRFIRSLRLYEQRKVLDGLLSVLSTQVLLTEPSVPDTTALSRTSAPLGASITLLKDTIDDDETLRQALSEWLKEPQRSAQAGPAVLRAVVATLSSWDDVLQDTLTKMWEQWADQLYIKHSPIAQQNSLSQALLLAIGYVHRVQPMFVFTMARSSIHTHGLSNRLASASPRNRWLGMVVGVAVSQLVDKPDGRLKFEIDELDTPEAQWYRQLTKVQDSPGDIAGLSLQEKTISGMLTRRPKVASKSRNMIEETIPRKPQIKSTSLEPSSTISGLRIVELDDDDLVPYAKPDSDPENDDPDPTTINRNKPKPPIYIRELIAYLNDSENIERRTLALQSAASLIRRKTHHGKEVSDHLEQLATVVAGLQDSDTFDVDEEEFVRLRERALRAVLVADAPKMGPWFAQAILNISTDYSVSQRTAMLIAIGLGGRELAGYKEPEDGGADAFPSKRLKGKMHEIWANEPRNAAKRLKPTSRAELFAGPAPSSATGPLDSVTKSLTQTMLEPLALEAADKLSGPDVLKVRKFSSRMDVEGRRTKPKANELSKIVAEAFILPLVGLFHAGVNTRTSRGSSTLTHYLLPTYFRTLALLLHSAGPSTPDLLSLTTEVWDLLLSLRSTAANGLPTLEALLFCLLTLLELNADREDALLQEHAKELIETLEWSKMVLENAPSGSEEEEKIKMLSAGIVVRCSDVVQKHTRRLAGDMVDM